MDIDLSWDLVILVGFAVLFGYNMMLGQRDTVKLIICTYVSIFAADGIASVLKQYVFDPSRGVQGLVGENEIEVFAWLRLGIFLLFIVLFVVKSGFHVHLGKHDHWMVRMGLHSLFSLICAFLLLTTALVYLSGISIVEGLLYARELNIYENSPVGRVLIDYMNIWFTLPAIAFLGTSFVYGEVEE